MERPDFKYYKTVLETQDSLAILKAEMEDLLKESEEWVDHLESKIAQIAEICKPDEDNEFINLGPYGREKCYLLAKIEE